MILEYLKIYQKYDVRMVREIEALELIRQNRHIDPLTVSYLSDISKINIVVMKKTIYTLGSGRDDINRGRYLINLLETSKTIRRAKEIVFTRRGLNMIKELENLDLRVKQK